MRREAGGLLGAVLERWAGRVVAVVVVTAVLYVVLDALDFDPRLRGLLLLVAAGVLGLALLGQSLLAQPVAWYPTGRHRPPTRGRDPVGLGHARLIEGHLSDRHPDGDLRDRLARLAEDVLRSRHGETLGSAAGRARLPRDVLAVLEGPPRRLTLSTIDTCVRAIEEL